MNAPIYGKLINFLKRIEIRSLNSKTPQPCSTINTPKIGPKGTIEGDKISREGSKKHFYAIYKNKTQF